MRHTTKITFISAALLAAVAFHNESGIVHAADTTENNVGQAKKSLSIQEQYDQEKKNNDNLHQQLTDTQNRNDQLNEHLASDKDLVENFDQKKADLKNQLAENQNNLKNNDAKTAGLKEKAEKANKAKSSAQEKAAKSKKAADEAKQKLDKNKSNYDSSYKEKADATKAKVDQLAHDGDSLKKKQTDITAEYNKTKDIVSAGQRKVADLQNQLADNQKQVNAAQAKADAATNNLNKIKSNLANQKAELKQLQDKLSDLQNKQSENDSNLAKKKAEKTTNENLQTSLAKKISNKKAEIANSEKEVKTLTDSLASLAKEKAQLDSKNNELNSQLNKNKQQLVEVKNKLDELASFLKNRLIMSQSYKDAVAKWNPIINSNIQNGKYAENNQMYEDTNSDFHKDMDQASRDSWRLNQFHHNAADEAHMIDINNMSQADQETLARYGLALINSARAELGRKPMTLNRSSMEMARDVAQGYIQDHWGIRDHHDCRAINAAAAKQGLITYPGSNVYEDLNGGYSGFKPSDDPDEQRLAFDSRSYPNDHTRSMDFLKQYVFFGVKRFLFNASEYDHAADMLSIFSKDYLYRMNKDLHAGLAFHYEPEVDKETNTDSHYLMLHVITVSDFAYQKGMKYDPNDNIDLPDFAHAAQERQQLETKQNDLQKNNKNLQNELNENTQKSKRNAQSTETKKNAKSAATKTLNNRKADLNNLYSQQKQSKNQGKAIQTEIAKLSNKKNDLNDQNNTLTKQISAQNKKVNGSQQQASQAQSQVDSTQNSLNQAKQAQSQTNQKLTQATNNLAKTIADQKKRTQDLKSIQKGLEENHNAYVAANTEAAKAQQALDVYNKHFGALAALINQLQDDFAVKSLQAKADASVAQSLAAKAQVAQRAFTENKVQHAALTARIKHLTARLNNLGNDKDKAKENIKLAQETSDELAVLTQKVAESDKLLNSLANQLALTELNNNFENESNKDNKINSNSVKKPDSKVSVKAESSKVIRSTKQNWKFISASNSLTAKQNIASRQKVNAELPKTGTKENITEFIGLALLALMVPFTGIDLKRKNH